MNFATAKEMSPYLEEPKAMPVGTPGKMGYLYLGFELDGDGKSIMRDLDRHAPLIVQQELYFDEGMPEMPCVYILSSGGPNVDGDRYEQHFVVREGAYAHISTGAATKLAEMRYNYSGLKQVFELEENACPSRPSRAATPGSSLTRRYGLRRRPRFFIRRST